MFSFAFWVKMAFGCRGVPPDANVAGATLCSGRGTRVFGFFEETNPFAECHMAGWPIRLRWVSMQLYERLIMFGSVYEMSSARKRTPLSPRMWGLDWCVFNLCEGANAFRNANLLNRTQLDGCRFGFV